MNNDELDIHSHLNFGCDFCELDKTDEGTLEQIRLWR